VRRCSRNSPAPFSGDAANRVTAIKNCLADASPLAYFTYDYDNSGRITSIIRENDDIIYDTYDNADRLTAEHWYDSVMSSTYAFAWDYDAVGNRTYESYNGDQTYYEHDAANELTQSHLLPADTHTYFSYDERGNCLTMLAPDGTTYYTYNTRNLMTSVNFRTGTFNYFHYDATGKRYAIHDSDDTTYFTHDKDGLCALLERDAAGSVTAEHIRGHSATAPARR